jgi:predicted DCC family thiol-disulfide oxidoreductase YuxK
VLDRREELAFLRLADEEAGKLLASVPEEARDECWWLVVRDGTPIPGDGGGAVALLSELGLTRPLGRLLRAVRASALLDRVDEVVARHRRRLGSFVPDGPAPRRYP